MEQRANVDVLERLRGRVTKISRLLTIIGFAWLVPLLKLAVGDSPKHQLGEIWRMLIVPIIGLLAFLFAWAHFAPQVSTSLGAVPGPEQVWTQAGHLWADYKAEEAKKARFYERQKERNAKLAEEGKSDKIARRSYTGPPTYVDQILTSLKTVMIGFLIATAIAVPIGILCGLSLIMSAALNPLIQIFKPVSPLAWLPIVTMVVSGAYETPSDAMPKSLVISALTVTLCSLWPTLINTALGVASIDRDLVNVGKVLQLSVWTTVRKLVLPSAMPLIFTGLRLSLGVGWMVLIAAEMLAQNPGLGKFVWDEFQNGSSASLANIMFAVLTIGVIGFLLDRFMYALQSTFTIQAQR